MDSLTARTASTVAEAIDAAGLTVLGVSEQAAIPRTTLIRRLDVSSGSPFTVAELEAVARVIGVSVGSLMARAEVAA